MNLVRLTSEERIAQRSRYVRSYLSELRYIYSSFRKLFTFVAILFWIQTAIAVLMALAALLFSGILGAIYVASISLNLLIVVWFATLAKHFVSLQADRADQDMNYQIATDQENAMTSNELLDRARKRAEGIVSTISIGGSNYGPIAVAQGENSKVSQSTAQEIAEKKDALALLKAYCQESNNSEALASADKIINEADKTNPDKNTVFYAWTRIVSLLPPIGQITNIVNTIRLMIG